MATINQNNPFNFSLPPGPGLPGWAAGQVGNQGAQSTDHGLSVGCQNTADNQGVPNDAGEWNAMNNGNGDSNDVNGDVTLVNTAVAINPTFAADNIFNRKGSIGLYGRSRGTGTNTNNPETTTNPPDDWSIGVLGQSSKGCGIYGLATDDHPTADQPSHGIGVVGRSVAGQKFTDAENGMSVEQVMGWNAPTVPAVADDGAIGVLGQSANGPGVRGHGGPLQRVVPPTSNPEKPPLQAGRGGVFSSGRREYWIINGTDSLKQEVSPDSCAQLQLVPSIGEKLPATGKLGDLFLQLLTPSAQASVQLWICTGFGVPGAASSTTPQWRPIQMGGPVPGGTKP